MEKYFYDKKDIMQITGYKESKAREIIKQLNLELEELYKSENKKIYIVDRGVPIWFFKKMTGIEKEWIEWE